MIYEKNDFYTLYHGKMQEELDNIPDNSIDCIITDPPYELNFMGKGWDNAGVSFQKDTWEKCCKKLKSGGYLLAFGGSRTFHRIACAIEDGGFEIRDTIMWLYGSGFPKSMNIGLAIDKKNGVDNRTGQVKTDGIGTNSGSGCYNCNNGIDNSLKTIYEEREAQNEWKGWGTCLKPAYEPIIVARKPFKCSLVENVEKYRVGGLNIDECRVKAVDQKEFEKNWTERKADVGFGGGEIHLFNGGRLDGENVINYTPNGRFPANIILDDSEEVRAGFPNTKGTKEQPNCNHSAKGNKEAFQWGYKKRFGSGFDNEGSAARYFYTAKASKKDRDEGLEEFAEKTCRVLNSSEKPIGEIEDVSERFKTIKRNIHPTVKPTELMQYLVRLVAPKGATILDPFNGSGSTGKAVMYENKERNTNYKYIGIEMTDEYLPISKARIDYVIKNTENNIFNYCEEKEIKY